jgi:hypothetical protein
MDTGNIGDLLVKAAGAGGSIFVLVFWVRYMVQELAAARALIAAKDAKLEQMLPMLERIANALDRIERRIDGPLPEHSNPGIRVAAP